MDCGAAAAWAASGTAPIAPALGSAEIGAEWLAFFALRRAETSAVLGALAAAVVGELAAAWPTVLRDQARA
eukprot:10081356-Alexandrium_andersonii.AAC.1